MHEVLVNRLGGLSLPRKSVVRLNDRPDFTLDVYRGRKTTTQQQQILFIVQRDFLRISGKFSNIGNVLQSYTIFHSEMFYKVLQYSIGKFFESSCSRLFFFLLDSSIYIIEQYTNIMFIKHQEKQITFINECI